MNLFDIIKSLKAEDAPIYEIPEQEKLQDYLRKQDTDQLTYKQISIDTGISFERIVQICNELSVFFRDTLAPKVFYKSMLKATKEDKEEFKIFFQRPDVDLALLTLTRNKEIWMNMKKYGTPSWDFMIDNWKKYRGY